MKKILIDGMSSNMGGVEKFVCTIYEALKDEWQVDFITVDESIPYQEEFLRNGSQIHKITPRYVSVSKYKNDIKEVFKKSGMESPFITSFPCEETPSDIV